ncbi:MAG: ATP-dependent protease [Gammaproteobacteria bacterium]|nr:MAG: ATP-dependent protease [Gammaproteobacteria bacterium]TND06468.1 MAG: ATP-dependent protease [Gammaproteobacteria bacterium]
MSDITSLSPEQLYNRCNPEEFRFNSTADLEDLAEVVGQARAMEALSFGIGIRREGYNLFALGPPGTGKHSIIAQLLRRQAATEPVPPDWCYVNNFADPHKPVALRLPPGKGVQLRDDVDIVVEGLHEAVPAAFDSDDYRARVAKIEQEFETRERDALEQVQHAAEERNVSLARTQSGFAFAAMRNRKVLNAEEFEKLPKKDREGIEKDILELQEQLERTIRQVPRWKQEARSRIKALNREIATLAVRHFLDDLRGKFSAFPPVAAYLNAFENDVIDHVESFRRAEDGQRTFFGMALPASATPSQNRYRVNVLVAHGDAQASPVIYEDSPSYQSLVGRVEHLAEMGALVTDFTMIKPGALHKANGGYLILDARKVLLQPYAWEGLKRALSFNAIRIESLGQMLSLVSTVSLEPESIPLDIKLVLIGDGLLYYLLSFYDPEFCKLFKVAVDFDDRMDRTAGNHDLYARLIATLIRKEGLKHMDRGAVARVIEHSSRVVDDAERLSTHMHGIADLLREADYWANRNRRDTITASDVDNAINARIFRLDRVRERVYQAIARGTLLIDTQGEKVAQVNALTVVDMGHFRFGQPSRVTARVRMGEGDVIDIEREVELGGPLHSKGVLILTGFLGSRYAQQFPLSVAATLVFEQSYGGVEGDSASLAELSALISALANVAIKQSLAITGSVNQHGQVQAIGGVNEKIEGFFDICNARGLNGLQGVLVPASNVKDLMLRADVVQAVRDRKFSVYPIETADQAITLLTGMNAGERDDTGEFPPGTVNRLVEARLIEWAEKRRVLVSSAGDELIH